MKVNQHQIMAFNAACRHKGFSRAAKALGVTQSSVTQNVAKLEAIIGAKLFERRRSGLVLTPAGMKIHAVTEEIGLLHSLLEERMSEYTRLDSGLLRVVAASTDPAMIYMRRFSELHPGVDLAFDRASWRRCADTLRDRDADVAIMPEPEDKAGLYVWPIGRRAHTLLVHPGHRFYNRESIHLHELADERIIKSSTRSFARWRLEERAAELGVVFSRVMAVGSTDAAIEAAVHRLGIMVTYATEAALLAGLHSIPIVELADTYQMVAACNSDVRDLSIVRSFFECID
ncbi:MAG TPA: LysR family transcriptional regulator [Devosiaceae bacterium]|jgi:DNA-binding transcriptional LysR family regulator